MPYTLTENAIEESTYPVVVAFRETVGGAAVVPTSVTWKLTDRAGNVMNGRSAVSISPAAEITIVLSGDDLQIGIYGERRILTVQAVYNSDLGSDLPLKGEAYFTIDKLVNVS